MAKEIQEEEIEREKKGRKCKSNISTVCITPELPGSCTIYRVYLTHTHTGAHSHLLVEGYLLAWSELRLP